MNIWNWVVDTQRELDESGHGRLAELMERLPHAVLEDENAEVEALVPEALALARALELPWVEIFIRHWHLQAVGSGYAALPEAVSLLEFSHREEHVACPQSVCTVQDLAIAYGGADGPGYAEERLAVTDEALARIDPSWPCYACIVGEKVSALVDAERYEEAVAVADRGRAEMAATGQSATDREDYEVEALLELGRAEDALERVAAGPDERDDSFGRWARLKRTLALLALDRAAEARETLLPLDVVMREPGYHHDWARAASGLVAAGEVDNDWRLGARLERMLAAQVERGRAWDGTLLAAIHARLALEREAPVTAGRALEAMRGLAARLRSPDRAADRIAALEAALAATPEPRFEMPDSPDDLLDELAPPEEDEAARRARDPERDAERLAAALKRWPGDLRLAGHLYTALHALGRPGEALAVLRFFADAHADDRNALNAYGQALVDSGDADGAEAVAARLEAVDATYAAWLRARCAYVTRDFPAAREHAEAVVAADPEAVRARSLLAMACEDVGDYAAALEHREVVLALVTDEPEVEMAHWNRLIPATVVGDWTAVRESAERLGMEFESDDGPVDEAWAYVRLRFDARDIVLGLRTGPVSARVLTVSLPDESQHAGDLVVFDPTFIGTTEDDEPPLFGVVKVLEEGPRRAYAFDGVYPGDDAWDEAIGSLREDGWVIDIRYMRGYEIEVGGKSHPGVYGWLAVPDGVDDPEAHARLGDLTANWEQPFTWLPLAEAAGDDEAAAAQRAHAEALALY